MRWNSLPASSKWPFDNPNGGHLTPEKVTQNGHNWKNLVLVEFVHGKITHPVVLNQEACFFCVWGVKITDMLLLHIATPQDGPRKTS